MNSSPCSVGEHKPTVKDLKRELERYKQQRKELCTHLENMKCCINSNMSYDIDRQSIYGVIGSLSTRHDEVKQRIKSLKTRIKQLKKGK